ncbi:RNA polymerase sigma factor [Candidatus Uhrbacteria bacterium]|nr:RNA polymerase sigma factor [Candidatus Uhrbacteria bacterium]
MTGNEQPLFTLNLVRPLFGFLQVATDLLGAFHRQESTQAAGDEELARRMGEGEQSAFDQLYERYFQKIYAFVFRRVSHREIAEDLVSEIFLKAFTHRRAFVWKTSFSAWIYRIAANAVTDHYRTKKTADELDDSHPDHAAGRAALNEAVDRSLLGIQLERVLELLQERERLAVTLKFYAECTNQEIAEALKCTPNNIGVILHRALKRCASLAPPELRRMMETVIGQEGAILSAADARRSP